MKIYADNAATTKMSPAAVAAMVECLEKEYGNPSSLYALGQQARERLEKARGEVAAVIGAEPEEITFESVCRAYSERFTDDTIANGLTYRIGSFPVAALEKAVLGAEEGKFIRVDVEKDGVYFVTRLPLDQTKLASERSAVERELEEIDEQGLTDSAAADFDVDEDVFASVVVADLKHAQ